MNNPEATRCLLCRKPRCSQACAVKTDVPTAMRLYREGRTDEVAAMLFANNPFSAVTSLVCDWQKNCYGHCILNAKNAPIGWHDIEYEVSAPFLATVSIKPGENNGRLVSIIGAGPAGITAAIKLCEEGYTVRIYDSNPLSGGVLRYGIPEFRLSDSLVDEYDRILHEAGIEFIGNTFITHEKLKEIRKSSDAVLVATGAAIPRRLDIPGEDNPDIIYALDYLRNPSEYRLGHKVLVIGGGNVTMDACRTAVRKGCDTWVYYRKSFENMPANIAEVKEAVNEGVHFELFEVPVAVKDHKAIMRKCENYTREDGKTATRMLEGTDHEVDFDSMLVAISASVDYSIMGQDSSPSELSEDQYDGLSGVFYAGDFVLGPATVVEAVESAKKAVSKIRDYLHGINS